MIKLKIKKFFKTDLFKTTFWNGIATVIKLFTGLVTNKIVAIYLGPGGIALLGQFNNFTSMVMSFATFGVNTGVTKYIAEYKDDINKRNEMISTGFYLILVGTLIASLVIFFGRYYFSDSILHTRQYIFVFIIFSVTLMLFTFNALFIAIFNGFKEFKIIIVRNILGSVISLFVAFLLVIRWGLKGALVGIILSQTLVFFLIIGAALKSKWFHFKILLKNFDKGSILRLMNFTLMTFVMAIFETYVQILVRNNIIKSLSVTEAGYWEGITRISNIYLMVITTTLSLYYLPRLSEIKHNKELKAEIFKGYKFILPLTVFTCFIIFILKSYIIRILYTEAFMPMLPLFKFQLSGDILKISSWLISYNLLARAMTKTIIITEIVFGLLYYFLNLFLVKNFGIIGTTYAYALNYSVYFLTMLILFFKFFKEEKNE